MSGVGEEFLPAAFEAVDDVGGVEFDWCFVDLDFVLAESCEVYGFEDFAEGFDEVEGADFVEFEFVCFFDGLCDCFAVGGGVTCWEA